MSQPSVQMTPTPHGTVATTISAGPSSSSSSSLSLLLLHGNSSSSQAFRHILASPPSGVSRVIAMDYPGHGSSENTSADPDAAYTQRGYAETAASVLSTLGVKDVAVLGWSLGGHVAIELVDLLQKSPRDGITLRGIMITGTPPANGDEQVTRGFDVTGTGQVPEPEKTEPDQKQEEENKGGGEEGVGIAAAEVWKPGDAEMLAHACHGEPIEPWMVDTARRTDGRARRIMFASFRAGTGVDQRKVLETTPDVVCAVVNGANEPFVNLDYVDAVPYANLWEAKCHRISGTGHAPFWEKPDVFATYLQRFVDDCAKKA